jgi:hypothetical protein
VPVATQSTHVQAARQPERVPVGLSAIRQSNRRSAWPARASHAPEFDVAVPRVGRAHYGCVRCGGGAACGGGSTATGECRADHNGPPQIRPRARWSNTTVTKTGASSAVDGRLGDPAGVSAACAATLVTHPTSAHTHQHTSRAAPSHSRSRRRSCTRRRPVHLAKVAVAGVLVARAAAGRGTKALVAAASRCTVQPGGSGAHSAAPCRACELRVGGGWGEDLQGTRRTTTPNHTHPHGVHAQVARMPTPPPRRPSAAAAAAGQLTAFSAVLPPQHPGPHQQPASAAPPWHS